MLMTVVMQVKPLYLMDLPSLNVSQSRDRPALINLWRESLSDRRTVPPGSEAAPTNGPAAQSSGSKLPRHGFSVSA
ncbi:hypothetical protein EMIT0196MI5_150100 [Pseudomonas sp. IT-196MI5]